MKDKIKIPVATKDIEGPEGKLKYYDSNNPLTHAITPKITPINIDLLNEFTNSFALAAGIINILRTRIIPTVWSEPIMAKDSIIRNK